MHHRSAQSPSERSRRSRLRTLLQQGPILRGNLTVLRNTCGRPNCRCARGERHQSLYVSQSYRGRRRARCVPRSLHCSVRQWVNRYQQIQQLLEQLSEMAWTQLESHSRKDKDTPV